MFSLKNLFKPKALTLTVSKTQKELLELLISNKTDFEEWSSGQPASKIKFQFFYPTAISFFYDEFKLFIAYFKKNVKGEVALQEFKMSETNYDTIRSNSWNPFEERIIEFLTSLEESKKIALFEKRKALFEYQSLCSKNTEAKFGDNEFASPAASPLQALKPTQ